MNHDNNFKNATKSILWLFLTNFFKVRTDVTVFMSCYIVKCQIPAFGRMFVRNGGMF